VRRVFLLTILVAAGCGGRDERPPPAPPPPAEPIRSAAGDEDLRVMLAQLAEGRGCDAIEGQFRALRDKARPEVVTGVLWIRGCKMQRHGTDVTLTLDTHGWQRVEKAKDKAGATFEVKQDVRFAAQVTVPGAFDVAYEPETHIASLWFTPTRSPQVRFEPIQEIAVEEESAWASTVGALGSLVGQSPERQAEEEAERDGESEMASQLSHGLGATLDLCSGLARFDLGRPGKGKMYPPGIGESKKVPIELHPTGLAIFGPYPASHGMTVHLDVEAGDVRAAIMCRAEAEQLGAAFVDGKTLPEVKSLALKDVSEGETTLRVAKSRCPLALVVRAIPDATGAPARFTWTRPAKEWAATVGGPLIKCR
jgi:hypothetical protein